MRRPNISAAVAANSHAFTDAPPSGLCYSAGPSYDFIPALDGLRAVSILLVLFSHLGLEKMVPGLLGVTIFFFISGFLITRQLLAEREAKGRIALGKFYIRRLLRLYPALLTAIVLGGILFWTIGGALGLGDTAAAVFYFSNYRELMSGFQSNVPGVPHPYGIYWSLAVEEHYYLIYPLAVLMLGRDRLRLAAMLILAIAAVTLWRFHIVAVCMAPDAACLGGGSEWRILHATDTRIDSILYGALLATLLGSKAGVGLLKILRSYGALIAGIVMIVLSIAVRDQWFRDTARFGVQGIGLFFAIGNCLFSPACAPLRSLLSSRTARAIGRWSYSLYLWHWLVLIGMLRLMPEDLRELAHQGGLPFGPWFAFALPVIILSVVAAAASYNFVERPILVLRRRFGSHPADATD